MHFFYLDTYDPPLTNTEKLIFMEKESPIKNEEQIKRAGNLKSNYLPKTENTESPTKPGENYSYLSKEVDKIKKEMLLIQNEQEELRRDAELLFKKKNIHKNDSSELIFAKPNDQILNSNAKPENFLISFGSNNKNDNNRMNAKNEPFEHNFSSFGNIISYNPYSSPITERKEFYSETEKIKKREDQLTSTEKIKRHGKATENFENYTLKNEFSGETLEIIINEEHSFQKMLMNDSTIFKKYVDSQRNYPINKNLNIKAECTHIKIGVPLTTSQILKENIIRNLMSIRPKEARMEVHESQNMIFLIFELKDLENNQFVKLKLEELLY